MPIPPAAGPAAAFTLNPFAEPARPPAILADKIDPESREYLSITEGYGIADGLVVTLLGTERGSGAAVGNLGQRFREVRYVEDNAGALLESLAVEALQPGRDAGVLRFDAIARVDAADPTAFVVDVDYTDLIAREAIRRRLSFER